MLLWSLTYICLQRSRLLVFDSISPVDYISSCHRIRSISNILLPITASWTADFPVACVIQHRVFLFYAQRTIFLSFLYLRMLICLLRPISFLSFKLVCLRCLQVFLVSSLTVQDVIQQAAPIYNIT